MSFVIGPGRVNRLIRTRQLYSSHSFMMAAITPFLDLNVQISAPATAGRIKTSNIGGSTSKQRWETTSGFGGAGDAKVLMPEAEIFGVTEAYPDGSRLPNPYQGMTPEEQAAIDERIDYLGRFISLARTQGNSGLGAEALIYAPWPFVNGTMGPFREGLVNSDPLWEYMRHGITETTGYEPRIIPAYRMMLKLWDEIPQGKVPGMTATGQLFRDSLGHPTEFPGYALGCLFFSVVYQTSPVGLPPPTGITAEQAEYAQRAAWEIATSYPAAEMGGTDRGEAWGTIQQNYGNVFGKFPLHFDPMTETPPVTAMNNLVPGFSMNAPAVGTGYVDVRDDLFIIPRGVRFQFTQSQDLYSKRVFFVVAAREGSGDYQQIMGLSTNLNRRVMIERQTGRVVLQRDSQWAYLTPANVVPLRGKLRLYEIEMAGGKAKLLINGKNGASVTIPWTDFIIDTIYGSPGADGFDGRAGTALVGRTNGSSSYDDVWAIARRQVLEKYGIEG